MTKRLAIQLFGHLRTFEQTYDSFYKNVILPNKKNGYLIDVFIHTWDEIEYEAPQWHSEGCEYLRGKKLSKEQIDILLKRYQPKKYEITPQLQTDLNISFDEFTGGKTSYLNVINVYYTKYRVNQLRLEYEKEQNIKYNWVMNTRCDIFYLTEFDIDKILEPYRTLLNSFSSPDDKLFYAGNHRDMTVKEDMLLGASDIIYFGKDNIINNVSEIYKKLSLEDLKSNFHSWENFQFINTKRCNIIPIQLKYGSNKDWKILRLKEVFSKEKKNKFSLKVRKNFIQLVLFRKYLRIEFGEIKK